MKPSYIEKQSIYDEQEDFLRELNRICGIWENTKFDNNRAVMYINEEQMGRMFLEAYKYKEYVANYDNYNSDWGADVIKKYFKLR